MQGRTAVIQRSVLMLGQEVASAVLAGQRRLERAALVALELSLVKLEDQASSERRHHQREQRQRAAGLRVAQVAGSTRQAHLSLGGKEVGTARQQRLAQVLAGSAPLGCQLARRARERMLLLLPPIFRGVEVALAVERGRR